MSINVRHIVSFLINLLKEDEILILYRYMNYLINFSLVFEIRNNLYKFFLPFYSISILFH